MGSRNGTTVVRALEAGRFEPVLAAAYGWLARARRRDRELHDHDELTQDFVASRLCPTEPAGERFWNRARLTCASDQALEKLVGRAFSGFCNERQRGGKSAWAATRRATLAALANAPDQTVWRRSARFKGQPRDYYGLAAWRLQIPSRGVFDGVWASILRRFALPRVPRDKPLTEDGVRTLTYRSDALLEASLNLLGRSPGLARSAHLFNGLVEGRAVDLIDRWSEPGPAEQPTRPHEVEDLRALLVEALDGLGERHQAALMTLFGRLDRHQVARRMGCSPSTIYSDRAHALNALAAQLKDLSAGEREAICDILEAVLESRLTLTATEVEPHEEVRSAADHRYADGR